MEFIRDLLNSKGAISSARLINITGAVTGFLLIMFDTLKSGTLDNTAFGIYLAYCAGVYATGKGLATIEKSRGAE
jgi:hypothetical protein